VAGGLVALVFLPVTTRLVRETIDIAAGFYSSLGLETSDRWRDAMVKFFRLWTPTSTIVFGCFLVVWALFWS